MKRIKIDRSRCIGCLTCVTACVVSHQTESGDARNRVTIDSGTKPAPIFCRHCERPEQEKKTEENIFLSRKKLLNKKLRKTV